MYEEVEEDMKNEAVERLIEVLCDLYQIKASLKGVDSPTLDLIIRKNETKLKGYEMAINLEDLKPKSL